MGTGIPPAIADTMNRQIVEEIAYFLQVHKIAPRLYLAYDRMAFSGIWQADLRVTFDANIRTRRHDLRLELGDYGEPLLDEDQIVMEVKALRSIPLELAQILSVHRIYSRSFSKYGNEYRKQVARDLATRREAIHA